MTSQRDVQQSQAAQVGFVMKSYRASFVGEDGRRGLTQEQLLKRMGSVDLEYAERYSHATVSRWESGVTRPALRRLIVFGQALNLSSMEIAGLVLLAGLAPDLQTALKFSNGNGTGNGVEAPETQPMASGDSPVADDGTGSKPTDRIAEFRPSFAIDFFKFLALVAVIAGVGTCLAYAAADYSWTPELLTGFAIVLVFLQRFVVPEDGWRHNQLFRISLFFVLSTPLLQFAPLGTDHYGFYAIPGLVGTHFPHLLALLTNLLLAWSAGWIWRLLWRWQYASEKGSANPLRRAVWVVLPPVGFVYGVIFVISNTSVVIQLAVLMPVIAAVFSVLLVLRDPEINPSERDRQFLLSTTVIVAVVTTSLGIIAILAIYVSPDLPAVLPDHNLLTSWEIDYAALGFTREEALDRLNLGYMWHAMCLLGYMVFVVGGNLIVAIYRIGAEDEKFLVQRLSGA